MGRNQSQTGLFVPNFAAVKRSTIDNRINEVLFKMLQAIECWHSLASKDKENRLKWIGLVAMGLNKRDSKSQEERAKVSRVIAF